MEIPVMFMSLHQGLGDKRQELVPRIHRLQSSYRAEHPNFRWLPAYQAYLPRCQSPVLTIPVLLGGR
jgi:hypothetical protein